MASSLQAIESWLINKWFAINTSMPSQEAYFVAAKITHLTVLPNHECVLFVDAGKYHCVMPIGSLMGHSKIHVHKKDAQAEAETLNYSSDRPAKRGRE